MKYLTIVSVLFLVIVAIALGLSACSDAGAAPVEMEIQAPTQFKGAGCTVDPSLGTIPGLFEMTVYAVTDVGDTVLVAGPFSDPVPGRWYPFTWIPPSGQGAWDFFGVVTTTTGESNGDNAAVCPITTFHANYDTRVPADPVIRISSD